MLLPWSPMLTSRLAHGLDGASDGCGHRGKDGKEDGERRLVRRSFSQPGIV